MSLMFADSRDHALTALVIKEAHQALAKGEGFVGRTAVQKIMYFLKALDVPMKYKFRLHHYGPYSDDLRDDVDCLLADEVVVDSSNDPRRFSSFEPSQEIDSLISKYKSTISKHEEVVRQVTQALVKFKPDQLELLMTLDYLYRVERAKEPQEDIRERVLDRFMDLKGNKPRRTVRLDRDTVSKWYDMMADLGLFE